MNNSSVITLLGRPGAPQLTPAKERMILMFIRAGATDYVACEAVGITQETFNRWMGTTSEELRSFREAVIEARGQARVRAEIRVASLDPEKWLTRGPGRERPGRPGWSAGQIQVTGINGGPVQVAPGIDLSKLNDQDLATLEALYNKGKAS